MGGTDERILVGTLTPLPEHRAAVRRAMIRAVERVHAEEEGCLLYALHESDHDLVMIERWSSPHALKAHSEGPALRELRAELDDKLASPPDVKRLLAVPAGTDRQGRI